jgi:hypothetical protein
MDAASVRLQLEETRTALTRLDAEREVLLTLVKGFEGWLQLHAGGTVNTPSSMDVLPVKPRRRTTTRGGVSMRQTVLKVMRDRPGLSMHVTEVLQHTLDAGAHTDAKRGENSVELILYSLRDRDKHPIEKVGPRRWRWIGTPSGPSDVPTPATPSGPVSLALLPE